jgi:Zn-dependent peptidase ImmA (M78 family)
MNEGTIAITDFGAALCTVCQQPHPQQVIEQLALDLVRRLGRREPPFSAFDYANMLGIDIEFHNIEAEGLLTTRSAVRRIFGERQTEPITGELTPARPDDSPVIVLGCGDNARPYVARQHFTVAHELSHAYLRSKIRKRWPDFHFRIDDPIEERLCDGLAAELIMPRKEVFKDIRHYGLSSTTLVKLAHRYMVSLQAMLVRVSHLFKSHLVAALYQADADGIKVLFTSPKASEELSMSEVVMSLSQWAIQNASTADELVTLSVRGQRSRWRCVSERISASPRGLTLILSGRCRWDGFLETHEVSSKNRKPVAIGTLEGRTGNSIMETSFLGELVPRRKPAARATASRGRVNKSNAYGSSESKRAAFGVG